VSESPGGGRAGIPTGATDNILGQLWAKVAYNAALNPLGALLSVPYGILSGIPQTRHLMDEVIREAYAVARAAGVGMPIPSADEYIDHFYGELVPPTAAHRSSMLQDIEAGRKTEIAALNGALARIGAERAVACPVNRALTLLVEAAGELS